jgi:hypothetical protein
MLLFTECLLRGRHYSKYFTSYLHDDTTVTTSFAAKRDQEKNSHSSVSFLSYFSLSVPLKNKNSVEKEKTSGAQWWWHLRSQVLRSLRQEDGLRTGVTANTDNTRSLRKRKNILPLLLSSHIM